MASQLPDDDEDDDEEDTIAFMMAFAAAPCPGCGVVAEPGSCPECGAEIPATDDTNAETAARRAAIGPLLDEAEELVCAFDRIPRGVIPVSIGQFATAITDGDLYGLTSALAGFGTELGEIDLNDSATVGGQLRTTVTERLTVTKRVLDVCEELSAMAPEAPGEEARELAIAAGRYGADLLATYLRIITSVSVTAVRENESRMNTLLEGGFPPGIRMSALLDEIGELAVDDVNERVARVLKRPGSYVDELGLLAPSLVFGAFADHDEPFAVLGRRSHEYFGHLLPRQLPEPLSAALLVIPAVTVAILDRPLVAHRCARLMASLCEQALEVDRDDVQRLVERTSEQASVIFAAAARIDRALRLLAVGERAGVVDDIAALDIVMKTLLELSEASFRSVGWLALGLQDIAGGKPLSAGGLPPTLGELEQRLAACPAELCKELAQSSDSALRNAAGHAQYTWDAEAEEVVDLRTSQRWDLDALTRIVDALLGAVAGTDAGYACFLVGRAIEIPLPTWAEGAGGAFLVELLAQALFAARGFEVCEISPDGGRIVLAADTERDLSRLVPVLAGLGAIATATTFCVHRQGDGNALVEVSAHVLSGARDAPAHLRDLALVDVMFDIGISTGGDPTEILHDVVAVLAKAAAMASLQQLATEPHSSAGFALIGDRLAYGRAFAKARGTPGDSVIREVVVRLERATAASAAVRSAQQPIRRLISALMSLIRWADKQGVSWPPV